MVIDGHTLIVLLLVILGGGFGVNLGGVIVKRLFGIKSDTVMHTAVVALSAVISVAQYLIGMHAQLPPEVLGVTGTSIYGWSQLVFKYAKAAAAFVAEVKAWNDAHQNDDTLHLDIPTLTSDAADVLATDTASPIPVASVATSATDF